MNLQNVKKIIQNQITRIKLSKDKFERNKHYFHWHAIGFRFCFCFLSIFQYLNYILFCSSLQWSGKENILHGYCNDILNRYMPWDDLKFW